MFLLNAAAICLSFLLVNPASAAVYKWTDAQGQVHFSDKPAAGAETLSLKSSASGWQPLAIQVIQQGSLKNQAASLDEARVSADVNNVYRFYKNVIYFDFYRQVPVKIHLLANRSEYLQFVRSVMGKDASQTLGIYIPSLHEIAVYLHEDQYGGIDSTYATIRHEASHAILDSLAERLPAWLHEGMSEQMETLTSEQGQLVISAHEGNRRQLQKTSGASDILAFMEIPSDQWQRDNFRAGSNQAVAGQVVFKLLSTTYGRSLVTRLLQDYKRGVNKRSFYLLDEHYVGGPDALSIHWQQWLKSGMTEPAEIRF
ncbi:DUF4124 domain-containing protein [Thalassolituus sp. LLYu03]|uniref:DUF4124 domain-containing protein n=1 Tax=Thalassolituus sp. LLYu03 TaxID=3421656 RepID=UPI003D26CD46